MRCFTNTLYPSDSFLLLIFDKLYVILFFTWYNFYMTSHCTFWLQVNPLKLVFQENLFQRGWSWRRQGSVTGPACLFAYVTAHVSHGVCLWRTTGRRSDTAKSREEASYTAARHSAFPSAPIKLFRRPPACCFMSGEGVEMAGWAGGQRHVLSCTKTGDRDF